VKSNVAPPRPAITPLANPPLSQPNSRRTTSEGQMSSLEVSSRWRIRPDGFCRDVCALRSVPSHHFVHGQDRSVIPEIEPPTRPRPVAGVPQQVSFQGIAVHGIQFLISLLRGPDVHNDSEPQFPPQLPESRNPLLPETLGIKEAGAIPPRTILAVK